MQPQSKKHNGIILYIIILIISFTKTAGNIRVLIAFLIWCAAVLLVLFMADEREIWAERLKIAIYSISFIFAYISLKTIKIFNGLLKLIKNNRTTQATITYIYGKYNNIARYKFSVSGKEYYGITSTLHYNNEKEGYTKNINKGDIIECIYLPTNPKINLAKFGPFYNIISEIVRNANA